MTRKRVLDFVAYIAIGIGLVLAMIWSVFAFGGAWMEKFFRWLLLAATTGFIFGYTLPPFRASMKRITFWTLVALLVLLHAALFLVAFPGVARRNTLWMFGLATPFECTGVIWVLNAAGFRQATGPRRPRSKGRGADRPAGP